MSDPRAELSSITSSLSTLTERVSAIAEQSSSSGDTDLATELFEVERSMNTSIRRLQRAIG